jgi:nitroreductase
MDFSMPLDEAMRTQRAIRPLKPDPVDDVVVLRLIELALKAPSGSNQQNWEFVIVKNRAVKEKLGALNRGMFRFYGGLGRRMAQNQPKMLRILDAVQWQADHFAEGAAGRRRLPARLLPSERGDPSDKTFSVALPEQGGFARALT